MWAETEVIEISIEFGVKVALKPSTWIKPDECTEKLRKLNSSLTASAGRFILSQAFAGVPGQPQGGSANTFAVGDLVKYYSKSVSQEFDATVIAVSPTNGIQINLKPGVWMAPGDVTREATAVHSACAPMFFLISFLTLA